MKKNYFPTEQLLKASEGSVYKLAMLAAKRALQLADGEKPLVESKDEKLLDIALLEIAEEKIKVKRRNK